MNLENPFNQSLTGLQLKDWVWYHTHNKTRYTSIAKTMGSCFNLCDEKYYFLTLCNNMPKVTEVPEKGVKYEIPCND